ncbi:MAG: Fic family protein [Dermatophilaceae bacterium]
MPLEPGYGETSVPGDEVQWLTPEAKAALGSSATKVAVYDLEQGLQAPVTEDLTAAVVAGTETVSADGQYVVGAGVVLGRGRVDVATLISDVFLKALHHRLYADIWTWAGAYRTTEVNIGVPPEQVAVELRNAMDDLRYRWEHTDDWTPRDLGIVVHAEAVRVHPFVDGNGRSSRLLADLVHIAAQLDDENGDEAAEPGLAEYDWDVDKRRYVELLRQYDRSRDLTDLVSFVPTRPFGV